MKIKNYAWFIFMAILYAIFKTTSNWLFKVGFLVFLYLLAYVLSKIRVTGRYALVTSKDGTPAPGRRIKLYASEPKQLNSIRIVGIYDIVPADDHQCGVIYAQCEEITEFYVLLRIIKCKGYDASVGDDVKILVGKKQIEAKVTEETELAKPINSTEEQPQ